jgi:hypothetical protein
MRAFTFTRSLTLGLFLSSGLGHASSLAIYQDSATYTFQPKESFIGFAKGLEAKCKGNVIPLKASTACPSEDRLCQELTTLKATAQKLKATQANIKVLNTLISLPQPTSFDASAWLEAAKRVGTEQAKLSLEESIFKQELVLRSKDFKRQAPTQNTLSVTEPCQQEVELTLPYGQLSFSSFYEADITDKKSVSVTQYLSITNKSGIDMQADDAMFFYRPSHRYIRPIHFSPWIVSKYTPPVQRNYAKAKRAIAMDAEPMLEMVTAGASPAPVAKYLNAREYQIKDLSLPSTGMPIDVQVTQWDAPLECDIHVYPYRNTTAFHTCSFTPKLQIDSNQWRVKAKGNTINDRAVGEYREGKYRLYTEAELDIKVERKPIVKREKTTGIFGSTARKKDGFTVKVTNKSDKPKTVTVTERIPTSTTEEIKVKLLDVKSDKKVNYRLLKDGEIEIKVTLSAHENKKIEVLFEISYDKDLKVSY